MATYFLDDLLKAIASSVAETNRVAQDAYLQLQKRHFRESSSADGATLTPKLRTMVLPRDHVPAGESVEAPVGVPESVLSHQNQVLVEQLTLEVDCVVAGLGRAAAGSDGGRVALLLGASIPPRSTPARLTIVFKSVDPPEGTARVNDKLLKKF